MRFRIQIQDYDGRWLDNWEILPEEGPELTTFSTARDAWEAIKPYTMHNFRVVEIIILEKPNK